MQDGLDQNENNRGAVLRGKVAKKKASSVPPGPCTAEGRKREKSYRSASTEVTNGRSWNKREGIKR